MVAIEAGPAVSPNLQCRSPPATAKPTQVAVILYISFYMRLKENYGMLRPVKSASEPVDMTRQLPEI